jgi:hypothetical protein
MRVNPIEPVCLQQGEASAHSQSLFECVQRNGPMRTEGESGCLTSQEEKPSQKPALTAPWSCTWSIQDCLEIDFSCWRHLVCGLLWWQLEDSKTLPSSGDSPVLVTSGSMWSYMGHCQVRAGVLGAGQWLPVCAVRSLVSSSNGLKSQGWGNLLKATLVQ